MRKHITNTLSKPTTLPTKLAEEIRMLKDFISEHTKKASYKPIAGINPLSKLWKLFSAASTRGVFNPPPLAG